MLNLLFPDTGAAFISHGGGQCHRVIRNGDSFAVYHLEGSQRHSLAHLQNTSLGAELALLEPPADSDNLAALCALLEAIFSLEPQLVSLSLTGAAFQLFADVGLAYTNSKHRLQLDAEILWQHPFLWLGGKRKDPSPLQYVRTQSADHPRRPAKPKGIVYQRYITWLGATLSFRAFDLDHDFDRFHHWMNDPFVAEIWDEAGDRSKHKAYLEALFADPHMIPLIGSIDDQPFAYFEIYFAKENRLAPFYEADDYDRGWHVLVGEEAFRGRPFVTAWLPSLAHYMFLDDPRTRRIVGEPRADHVRQIRNLEHCGYDKVKDFDFPHKRATLVMLPRQRFFSQRLWIPRKS